MQLQDSGKPAQVRSGFFQTVSAVLWSFFGVRKGRDHDRDMATLNPVHVIITGVLAGAVFVMLLVILVRFILGQAGI